MATTGPVVNELESVQSLRKAIPRFKAQVDRSCTQATKAVTAAETRARAEQAKRRAELQRRAEALRHVQQALAACRQGCGGLQQQVVEAARAVAHAEQRLAQASKAVQLIARASADLATAIRATRQVVDARSDAAGNYLAELETRIAEIVASGHTSGSANRGMSGWKKLSLTAEIAVATMDFSKMAGNASQGYLPTAEDPQSITEFQEERMKDLHQYYAGSEQKQLEDESSEIGKRR